MWEEHGENTALWTERYLSGPADCGLGEPRPLGTASFSWSARADAEAGIDRFEADCGAKAAKAVTSLRRTGAELITVFDFSAERWEHIRTSNSIESTFATVRLRQRIQIA